MSPSEPAVILILEDDPGVAKLQQRRLERAGYTVLVTNTPEEARDILSTEEVELLLLDNHLPDSITGLEFYNELKSEGNDLPVILVTGFSDDKTVIRALRAGVRDFVTKSLEYLDYLPEAVRRVLNQVQTEQQLAASEKRFRFLISNTPAVIYSATLEGAFALIFVSDNVRAQLGYEPSELLSAPGLWLDIVHPDDQSSVLEEFQRARHKPMIDVVYRIQHRDGRWRWIRNEAQLTSGVNGRPAEVVGYWIDVTERQQLLESLQETNRTLEQALQQLHATSEEVRSTTQQLWQAAKLASVGELAASIAHELNNPLATISLRLESVLQQTSPDDPRRRPLEIIEQESERMSQLVANMLHFSRQGKEQVSSVNVVEEVQKTLELIEPQYRQRKIRVVQAFAPALPTIFADRQKLRQVLLNLLTNAGDAMLHGGTLTLRLAPATMDSDRPAVEMLFSDTGHGIPREHLHKIMDPFFTTKPEGKGTGLGLAICRRIIQEHCGTIEIESEAGRGTTVRIVLPVANGINAGAVKES